MNRRELFKLFATLFLSLCFPLKDLAFAEKLDIEHPIKDPPEYTDKKRCDNCGMDRNRWARTRYIFDTSMGRSYACSIHCLATLGMKLGEQPQHVKVADYLHPERMLDAKSAFYVLRSKAPGTMTGKSKPAFSSRAEAEAFTAVYGGRIVDFQEALSDAEEEIQHRVRSRR